VSPWVDDAICPYPPYPVDQIDAVIALARGILKRHPEIEASRVVGHADIQPENKTDPGPMFPWRQLAAAGIGAWYDDSDVAHFRTYFAAHAAPLKLVQQALIAYGYGLEASGLDDLRTHEVLSAFQSHFLPDRRSGVADVETVATLFALLSKYRTEELRRLRENDADLPSATGASGK
jgi:N-acetyl-anhydromuramyl-L-alanine amidase AmpD